MRELVGSGEPTYRRHEIFCYIAHMIGEVWLNNNRRVLLMLATLAAVAVVTCAVWFVFASSTLAKCISGAFLGGAVSWLALILYRFRQPRMSYSGGKLLLYLRGAQPLPVPIEIVECFFLGQAPSMLPRSLEGKHGEAADASTIVVRLAESAIDWHHRDVRGSLGQWCEGYITIRGTWCEPLSGDLVMQLNRRLVEAHRATRRAADATVPA